MASDKVSPTKKNDNGNGLILYQYYPSYFSQKVAFALFEKKLKFKSHLIDLSRGEQLEPWFLKLNPKCEVPVLKDGVKIIPDSRRIIDYIEDNFSNGDTPRLIPEKGSPNYQTMERMRDLLDNIPNGLITFGCLKHPELTGEIKMPPQEIKARQNFFLEKQSILNDYAEKYKEYKDHYLVKKASTEKFIAQIEDKNEVEKGILDVLYALKESEKLLASQSKGIFLRRRDESFVHLLNGKGCTKFEEDLENYFYNDGAKTWLCGEKFTIADISLCVLLNRLNVLGLLDKFFKDHDFKHLQDYYKRAQQRDSFKRTMNQSSSIIKSFSSMDIKDQFLVTIGSIAVIAGAVGIATFLIHRNK